MALIFVKAKEKEWCVSYDFLQHHQPALFHIRAAENMIWELISLGINHNSVWAVKDEDHLKNTGDEYFSVHVGFTNEADEAEFILKQSAGVFSETYDEFVN